MEKKYEFIFNGYKGTVIIPDNFNGKWVWKTEFFYAFDNAEQDLLTLGYARVNYEICDMYGSYRAVRFMHDFYKYIVKEYKLNKKAILFGFSRGGLYAFNFALYYPEYVEKIYLDAPVLNLKSWPQKDTKEQAEMFCEYFLSSQTLKTFTNSPINNLAEFFSHKIPLLVIAGDSDDVVPMKDNCNILFDYCEKNNIKVEKIIKKGCGHHPHGLEDTTPVLQFVGAKK